MVIGEKNNGSNSRPNLIKLLENRLSRGHSSSQRTKI